MKQNHAVIAKRGSTLILRAAIIALGVAALAICIFALPATWMAVEDEYPQATYVFYSIILAMYAAAVPFFVALWQALKMLGYIDKNKAFSQLSVKALRNIAWSGVVIGAIFIVTLPFFYMWADKDDAPGLVVIAMVLTAAPFVVAVFAALIQRLLREVIDIKSENDLTV